MYVFFILMNQEFKKLCLISINKLNEHIDRKRYRVKYSDEYYLNFIFFYVKLY
jgi:hypothetical protein